MYIYVYIYTHKLYIYNVFITEIQFLTNLRIVLIVDSGVLMHNISDGIYSLFLILSGDMPLWSIEEFSSYQ